MLLSTFKIVIYIISIQLCLTNPINKNKLLLVNNTNCIDNNEINTITKCNITNNFNNTTNSTNKTLINHDNKLTSREIRFLIILGCSLFLFLLIICYYDYKNNIGCKPLTKI